MLDHEIPRTLNADSFTVCKVAGQLNIRAFQHQCNRSASFCFYYQSPTSEYLFANRSFCWFCFCASLVWKMFMAKCSTFCCGLSACWSCKETQQCAAWCAIEKFISRGSVIMIHHWLMNLQQMNHLNVQHGKRPCRFITMCWM